MTHNVWFDVMRLDAGVSPTGDSGIVLAVINRPSGMSISGEARRQLPRVSVGPDGRIFWPEERTGSGTGPGARRRRVDTACAGGDAGRPDVRSTGQTSCCRSRQQGAPAS